MVLTELGLIVDGHAMTSILHLFDGRLVLHMHPQFELNFVLHLSTLLLLRPIFSFGLGPSQSIAELLPQLEDFEAGAFDLGVEGLGLSAFEAALFAGLGSGEDFLLDAYFFGAADVVDDRVDVAAFGGFCGGRVEDVGRGGGLQGSLFLGRTRLVG